MIGQEARDFLREDDRRHHERHGGPKQHRAQIAPVHRAQLCAPLLGVGFWQQRGAKLCAVKRSYLSAVLLWTAVALVVATIVFPQEIAGFLADHLSGAAK